MHNRMLDKGADTITRICAQIQENEEVLIITETRYEAISDAIVRAVKKLHGLPTVMIMEARNRDGEEPDQIIAAAMKASNVFLCIVSHSITHAHAVKNATAAGSRGLVLTQFHEDMLIHGGITCDFVKAKETCMAVAECLENGHHIHLETAAGTNLTLEAEGRRGNALYGVVDPGMFSTIPTIEANVSPLEYTANGVIVADASIPYVGIGLLKEPVICTVEKGFITDIQGGEQAMILKEHLHNKQDPNVFNIAELGIGLNPRCSFIGWMLEDEGVYGSAHIGIGTSITLGGTVKAACHYDLIMKEATVSIDGKRILDHGSVLV